jgi:hypothetical protein
VGENPTTYETTGVEATSENETTSEEDDKIPQTIDEDTDEEGDKINQDMNALYGQRTGHHNLRPRRKPSYSRPRRKPSRKYRKADYEPQPPQDHSMLHATLEHYAMMQYSVKQGLRIYGEAGKEAMYSEMQQLHEMEVVEPKKGSMLTRE